MVALRTMIMLLLINGILGLGDFADEETEDNSGKGKLFKFALYSDS